MLQAVRQASELYRQVSGSWQMQRIATLQVILVMPGNLDMPLSELRQRGC